MRIIPYELYEYAPDLSLTALRKEFGMHDYCLNLNLKNKAMQPFLDMGRNYFNLLVFKWNQEMLKRNHYINTFHSNYALNTTFTEEKTDYLLILECIIQWELKDFEPYNTKLKWFDISIQYFQNSSLKNKKFTLTQYNSLLKWYKEKFMCLNDSNKLKPKNLDINLVLNYFKEFFSTL
ncbi:hypothetical protein [Spiroplasma floricola]|uniref:Uncharacterized protein n=1 Tax=Spiroplasma floricola 23-6 TaxID=1336749 RepID=A0A2K8SDJ5_9MOLU|nr:hypothetical protein [Spiroplasma floricola]AUB31502.1 hypothetical protein SFLOR_v1c04500 [Spiroplasma floricola 23-6]